MNVCTTFEANAKATEIVEPRVSSFDHPAEFAQATAMLGAPLGDSRSDAALAQASAMRLGIVATIRIDDAWLVQRSATKAANRRHRVNQRQQLGNVVAVCAGQDRVEGDAIGIDEEMMLGTGSRAIGGVRSCFWPAPSARTDDESTAAREKSSCPASRSLASNSACNWSHTLASCQSRKRRQQVTPDPNPNSMGRSRQHMPVLKTNRMPLSAARFDTGSRPGYFLRRGLGAGSSGSINAHNSSSMIGALIPLVPVAQMAKVNSLQRKLTAPLGSF